mmetsp:Transcript_28298/g.61606  ORF Transcript_28298/g.61606 Transcript_28298/m.61606 type:complete len:217 (+) Transcript_28298:1188-1838(+)
MGTNRGEECCRLLHLRHVTVQIDSAGSRTNFVWSPILDQGEFVLLVVTRVHHPSSEGIRSERLVDFEDEDSAGISFLFFIILALIRIAGGSGLAHEPNSDHVTQWNPNPQDARIDEITNGCLVRELHQILHIKRPARSRLDRLLHFVIVGVEAFLVAVPRRPRPAAQMKRILELLHVAIGREGHAVASGSQNVHAAGLVLEAVQVERLASRVDPGR